MPSHPPWPWHTLTSITLPISHLCNAAFLLLLSLMLIYSCYLRFSKMVFYLPALLTIETTINHKNMSLLLSLHVSYPSLSPNCYRLPLCLSIIYQQHNKNTKTMSLSLSLLNSIHRYHESLTNSHYCCPFR